MKKVGMSISFYRTLKRKQRIIWRGRWEAGSGWGIHVKPGLILVNVWQKPLQYCKVISLQLIKKIRKKKTEDLIFAITIFTEAFWDLKLGEPSELVATTWTKWGNFQEPLTISFYTSSFTSIDLQRGLLPILYTKIFSDFSSKFTSLGIR